MKKCIYRGKQVTLTDKEFLASGGQGDVYLHSGIVFKIYHSALQPELIDKIKELSVLDRTDIIRPLDVLYDEATNTPIGYTMEYVDNAVGAPLLFTSSYLSRNGISLSSTQTLVSHMSDTLSFIHDKAILVVDYNEMNLLIDKATHTKPYHIDVDSYQTPKHRATVIMPSIRDYVSPNFNRLTDWYSFGVISFQLFTGIHPYKGKHPILKTLEDRCKNHVSVFNKDVTYPLSSVRDFNNIPPNYLDWYKEIFENGQRLPPPVMVSTPQIRTKRKYVSATFDIEKIFTADEPIKSVSWVYGNLIILTEHFIYVNGKKFDRHHSHSVVSSSSEGVLFEVYFDERGMFLTDILKKFTLPVIDSYRAKKWFTISGRLYSIFESQLFEFEIRKIGTSLLPVIVHTQPIQEHSSQVFANVIYADILGKAYFYIPCVTKSVVISNKNILDGMKIIDAIYDKEQLVVIAVDTQGNARRYRSACATDGSDILEITDIDIQETNTTVLSNGLSLTYDSAEDQIDLVFVPQTTHKILKDVGLPQGATLVSTGVTAHYFVDDSLYKFSVKK